ncbi:putative protein dimerization activity [Lyophyllum shimeji]|uniref:Uncharacterized protein n=1 Tax=Lyophyllum shimeji TaxID=47721 RepID=A0A9P3PQB4_LYOSH|nr:putative protein dimerization activity [Lyophyllum shimeji]
MSKRKQKASKRARRALGLPSSSSEDDGSPSDSSSNHTVNTTRDTQQTSSQAPTSSSASLASSSASRASSSASLALTPATSVQVLDKRAKFDIRYKVATRSDEEVLKAQMESWTSDIYKHFVMPPNIVREGDVVRYIFVCKAHPSITISCVRYDKSTSNLVRHGDRCTSFDSKEACALVAYVHGSSYTPEKLCMKLALWVSRRSRPFTIIADPELLDIFKDLNANVVVPSPQTVSRDVKEIYMLSREQVIEVLKVFLIIF